MGPGMGPWGWEWGWDRARTHLGVGRQEIQGRDAEPELLGLGELSKAGARGHQAVPGNAGRQLQQLLTAGEEQGGLGGRAWYSGVPIPGTARASPQVVHAVPVQAEAVGAIGPVHQQLDVLADAAGTEP